MKVRDLMSMPLAPLTYEQIVSIAIYGTGNLKRRLFQEGYSISFMWLIDSFNIMEDEDNKVTVLDMNEDGDYINEDGEVVDEEDVERYFPCYLNLILISKVDSINIDVKVNLEKLLEIVQPLNKKLESFIQRRKNA